MLWTYRVFHDDEGYCVRVVYQENDGRLIGYDKELAIPNGQTPEELAQDIAWFREAFELPIVTMEALDQELAENPPLAQKERGTTKTLDELLAEFEEEEEPIQTTNLIQPKIQVVMPETI